LARQIAGVLSLQRLFGGKSRLPVPLQRACDQAHVGVHGLVTPTREDRFVAHPLQALRPVPVLGCAFKLDVLSHLQADLDGRWRQGRKDQLSHQRVYWLGARIALSRNAPEPRPDCLTRMLP